MVSECLFFQGVKEPRRVARGDRAHSLPHRAPLAREAAEGFLHDLFRQVGLSAEAYRGRALNRRIPACLRFLRVRNLEDAHAKLQKHPELIPPTISVVLLGVTDFFRDQTVFEQLQHLVVPSLALRKRALRVWSAACSDGRELCSVAMVLNKAGLLTGADLLGTDCRADAISRAQLGQFSRESLDKLDPRWKEQFTVDRQGVRLPEPMRQTLRWKQADLLQEVEPGPWDLVLWRNMAIYLEASVAAHIWDRLFEQLAPGGYLVTGKADHPPRHSSLIKVAPCIYRKIEINA